MKRITFILLLLTALCSFGQNLSNPSQIGQTTRNHKVGNGFQVDDTLLVKGVVWLSSVMNGSGTDSVLTVKDGLLKKIPSITGSRAVDTIFRTPAKDSIIFTIGGTRYAIKDSTGGGGASLSDLTNATDTNTITNVGQQEWRWNALSSGIGLKLSSNSTAAASNTQTIFSIEQTGANANATQTTFGARISNTKTGTTSTNVGLSLTASGATNNYALVTTAGRVGINTANPSALIEINTANGGFTNGLHLTQTSNNSNTEISYNGIQFNVPTTGNIGSLLSTASNYSWSDFNILPNSIALLSSANNSQLGLFAGANSFMTFNTNGLTPATERMRITSAGNIGIGTSTPAVKLDVYNGRIRTTNTSSSGNGTTAYELYVHNGSSVALSGILYSTNSTFSYGTILANQTSLFAQGSGGLRLGSVIAPIIFSNGNSDADFAVERMRITSTGNIGIGTSTPSASAKLELSSTTQGFLPSRATGAQIEAVASPAEGLLFYSTDGSGVTITSKGWWGFDGTNWVKLN